MDEDPGPTRTGPAASPARARTRTRTWARLLVALLVAVGSALTLWIRLGPTVRGTAWAEDGGLFLRERVALGPVDSLLHPYAGYLHLVPRLAVDAAVALPIDRYALSLAAIACGVVGVVAASVFLLARDVVRSWPLRLVLAAVPALAPLGPVEIAGNVANLHWYLLFAAPWVFAARSRSWWAAAGTAALAGFVTLTEVQSVVFLPLLVLAWIGGRTPGSGTERLRHRLRALPVTVVAVTGGAAQVAVALTTDRAASGDAAPVPPADIVFGYLAQVVGGSWSWRVGRVGAAVAAHGWAVLAVPAVVFGVCALVALVVARRRARVFVVALTGGSVAVWAAAMVLNQGVDLGWATVPVAELTGFPPLRYAAAASMLLLASVVVVASVLIEHRPSAAAGRVLIAVGRVLAAVGWVLVTVVVAAFVLNTGPVDATRSGGPVWAPQIVALRSQCERAPSSVVKVSTAPWGADVPCGLVLGDG